MSAVTIERAAAAGQPARRWLAPDRIVVYALLVLFAVVYSIPFYWLVSTSFKLKADIAAYPIVWVPTQLTFEHYAGAFLAVPLARYIGNTAFIGAACVVGAVASNALTAYGLARINWPLARPLLMAFLGTMMIPFPVTMIPLFIVFKTYGWIDTYLPLIVPTYFASGFFIFLLRQFFMTIPTELSDAARMDGANELSIFVKVILPLTKPALATIALFQFIGSWEDFLGPLIYISKKDLYTVSIGLAMFRGEYTSELGPIMAGSTVMILPIIVLFFLTQRTFIQGITLTGIKG